MVFLYSNFKFSHKPGGSHPEVVPHHENGLHSLAIALTERLHQFSILSVGVKPLLELVHDEQYLLARRNALTPTQQGQRVRQVQGSAGNPGQCFRRPLSKRVSVSSPVASM